MNLDIENAERQAIKDRAKSFTEYAVSLNETELALTTQRTKIRRIANEAIRKEEDDLMEKVVKREKTNAEIIDVLVHDRNEEIARAHAMEVRFYGINDEDMGGNRPPAKRRHANKESSDEEESNEGKAGHQGSNFEVIYRVPACSVLSS